MMDFAEAPGGVIFGVLAVMPLRLSAIVTRIRCDVTDLDMLRMRNVQPLLWESVLPEACLRLSAHLLHSTTGSEHQFGLPSVFVTHELLEH
jgi:hypothetical protein